MAAQVLIIIKLINIPQWPQINNLKVISQNIDPLYFQLILVYKLSRCTN